jgi:hypothetical protein
MKSLANKASESYGYLVNRITGKTDSSSNNRFQSVSSDNFDDYKPMDDGRDGNKKQSLIDRDNY